VSRGRVSSGTECRSSVTCSFSSVSARIGSNCGAHRAMQSSRQPWQVPHWLRCRVTVNRRAAGNTMTCRGPACGSPLCRPSASTWRSSSHPGASPPGGSRPASPAASAVTSKARSIACRFSRRSRRTSAALVPSSRAAFRLSRPLVTNRSKSRCRASGSVAAICSSQCCSNARLASESCISSPCWQATSVNTAAPSRSVWACLKRRTRAASACSQSLADIAATPTHGQSDLIASRMPQPAYLRVQVV
jgi:hypothetical protein